MEGGGTSEPNHFDLSPTAISVFLKAWLPLWHSGALVGGVGWGGCSGALVGVVVQGGCACGGAGWALKISCATGIMEQSAAHRALTRRPHPHHTQAVLSKSTVDLLAPSNGLFF